MFKDIRTNSAWRDLIIIEKNIKQKKLYLV